MVHVYAPCDGGNPRVSPSGPWFIFMNYSLERRCLWGGRPGCRTAGAPSNMKDTAMTGSRLVAAHRLRLRERQRYLKANLGGEERWQRYEQLIWDKYAPGEPLDVAWLNRDEARAKRRRGRS